MAEANKRENDPVYKAKAELKEAKGNKSYAAANARQYSDLADELRELRGKKDNPSKLKTVGAVRRNEERKMKDQARIKEIEAEQARISAENKALGNRNHLTSEIENKEKALEKAKQEAKVAKEKEKEKKRNEREAKKHK